MLRIETKHVFSLVIALVLANLLISAEVLSRLLPAMQIERFDLRGLARVCHVGSLVLVSALLALRSRLCFDLRVWHVLLGSMGLLVSGEAFLRVTLFTDLVRLPFVEYPGFYADPFSEDDFWVLEYRWSGGHRARQPAKVDRVFGWTASNGGSLEVSGTRFREPADVVERPVLFFGDSFVADLPERLEALLPGYDVLNYGVGGYATDQILMRVERQVPLFRGRDPVVLIGVLLEDMDRSLLRFRGGQKPYFTIESGQLALHSPAFLSNDEFVENYTFQKRSFLVAAAVGMERLLTRRFDGDPQRRNAVNRFLFQRACRGLAEQHLEAAFVVFLGLPELREVAAGQEPRRLHELRSILREACSTRSIETSEFLLTGATAGNLDALYVEDGHHSGFANEIISRNLAQAVGHEILTPAASKGP